MNGKQAKRLRAKAHSLSVGFPWIILAKMRSGSRKLATNSGRRIYQGLKKAYFNGP